MPIAVPGVAQAQKTIICDGIATGATQLSTVSVNGMPSFSTVAWVTPARTSYVLQPNTGGASDGSSLVTSADGSRQWVATSSVVHYREDIYEASATWTNPNPVGPGFAEVWIVGTGASGGGGGGSGGSFGSGGGGPGGISSWVFPLSTLGVSVAVTVPAPPPGVLYSSDGLQSIDGSDCSFGTFLRATGGKAAKNASNGGQVNAGGLGGWGTFGQSPSGASGGPGAGANGGTAVCGVFPGAGASGGAPPVSPGAGVAGFTGGTGGAGATASNSIGNPGGIGATAAAGPVAGFNAAIGTIPAGGGGGGGLAGDVQSTFQEGAAGGKYGGGGGGAGAWGGVGSAVFTALSGAGGPGVVIVRCTYWS